MSHGTLVIQVSRGTILSDKIKEGKASYFVALEFPAGIVKTAQLRTEKSDMLQFHFQSEVTCTAPIPASTSLALSLMKSGMLGLQAERAGTGQLSLQPLAVGASIDSRDVEFQSPTGEAAAKIQVTVAWREGTMPAYAAEAAASGATAAPDDQGAAGGGGGMRIAGAVGAAKLTPLPACEGQDYSIRVKVHKCKNLQATDDSKLYSPRVVISALGKSRKTEVCKNTNDPIFDEDLALQFDKVKSMFWTEVILITVVNERLGIPNETIGMVQLETGTVYRASNHCFARKWLVLFRSVTEGNVMGFIKLSISVLNLRTDGAVEDEEEEDDADNDDDMMNNLISVPGAAFEEIFLHCNVECAEGIPKMDPGALGFADPFVRIIAGKKSAVTAHQKTTLEPKWRAKILLPMLLPSLASTITIQLLDHQTLFANRMIATYRLDMSELSHVLTRDGLPTFPPRWINFYGHPRVADATFNKYYKAMSLGEKKGVDYRGRLLMQMVGSRSREPVPMPEIHETIVTVTLRVDVLMLSMLPENGKFKIKVMMGTNSASTLVKETTPMRVKGERTKTHAVFFDQSLEFKVDIPVVVPAERPPPDSLTSSSFDRTFDESDDSETTLTRDGSDAGSPRAANAAAVNPTEVAVWQQVPAVVVHLIAESFLKPLGDVLDKINRTADEMPIAATVFAADKIHEQGNTMYICKPMRLMVDPDQNSDGRNASNPLVQLGVTLTLDKMAPPNDRVPLTGLKLMKYVTPDARRRHYLECFIYRGRRFPPSDSSGLSDPYIQVSWANGCARTGAQLDTLTPVYNEAIYVEADTKHRFPDVVVEIWDWDLIGRNTFMCKAVIPFEKVSRTPGVSQPQWFDKWTDCHGNRVEHCAVLMHFTLHDERFTETLQLKRTIEFKAKPGKKKTYTGYPIPVESLLPMATYCINLNILGLRNMRRLRLREVSHPNLEFVVEGTHIKTPKVRGTNANFDTEIEWMVNLPEEAMYLPELEIRVYENRVGPKQIAGSSIISLGDTRLNKSAKNRSLVAADDDAKKRITDMLKFMREEEGMIAAAAEMPTMTETFSPLGRPKVTFKSAAKAVGVFSHIRAAAETHHPEHHQQASGAPAAAVPPPPAAAAVALAPPPVATPRQTPRQTPRRTAADIDAERPLLAADDTVELHSAPVTPAHASINMSPADAASGEWPPPAEVLPPAAEMEIARAIDDVIREAENEAFAMSDASMTEASSEPDELFWFDRYDADPSGMTAADNDVIVAPEIRVARFGRLARHVPGLDPSQTTAEDFYGPFNDELLTLDLHRGWGKKKVKAGALLCDVSIQRIKSIPLPRTTNDAHAVLQAADATSKSKPSHTRKRIEFMARVYIIGCRDLAAKSNGPLGTAADPYVTLRLTNGGSKKDDVVVTCKDQTRYQDLNPEYFMVRELRGVMPTHNTLRITVMDWDRVGFDEEIGSTEINLEDRYYSRRGYRLKIPPIQPQQPEDARRFFNLNNSGCYAERRVLRNDTGQSQGTITIWVDVFDATAAIPRPIDIAPPPPIPVELRVVVWNARDVELVDSNFAGEEMTDIYIKCFMDGMVHNTQQTDVHYRSLDGSGNFNWRMMFPFVFEPRSKRIFRASKEMETIGSPGDKTKESGGAASTAGGFSLFSVRKEAKRLVPNMHVQIFDNDLFPGADDFIGEGMLNLTELRPCLTRRAQKSLISSVGDDCRVFCNRFPFNFCCGRCCCKPRVEKDTTLEARQALAREEYLAERQANRDRVESIVEEKMELLTNSGRFSDLQLTRMRRKITREARRANRINVFAEFMPKRKKKSQREQEDKEFSETVKAAEQEAKVNGGLSSLFAGPKATGKINPNSDIPTIAETSKYWFACRGPNGGCRVGDVQLSFQLVQLEALQRDTKLAAGKGRSEPQSLPEPDRPPSSFFWLSSPWKAAVFIFWKNYKWYIAMVACLVLLAVILYLFFSTGIRTKAEKFFNNDF